MHCTPTLYPLGLIMKCRGFEPGALKGALSTTDPSLKFSSSKTHLDIWQLDDIEALKSYYQDEYFKVLEEDKG